MKRILHIVGKMDRAGAETMLMNIYRNIDKDQIQFDFVTFTNDKGDYDDEIIKMGGNIIPIIASNNISRLFKLKTYLMNHPEYSIVHIHMLLNSSFSLLASKLAGIQHRICHSHSTSNGNLTWLGKIYETWAIRTINKVSSLKIACGHAAAEYLYPQVEDVLILPNAVEVEGLAELQDKINNEARLISSKNVIKILQVGRLSEVKNPFFTLEIAKKIKGAKVSAHIYLIGQGNLREQLAHEIVKHNLEDVVTLLGLRSDVPQLMSEANILLMPSLHEGFPVVLVESQAVGLPAIVSTEVSREVDLGVGLMTFLPTNNNTTQWLDMIIKLQDTKILNKEKRIVILKQKGFDVVENAKQLQNLYMQMK